MPLLVQGMWVCHMLVRKAMVVVMVMVMVHRELWQRSRVYVLVWEVMPHHGEPTEVVEKVMVMELVVVVGPERREWQGHEAWGRSHRKRPWRRIPRPTRHGPHRGPPALRSSSCPRSSCRRRSSRLSRCTPNGTMPAANCA